MSWMYPHLLGNADVMISTLQKRLQDALLSLVGPSSSFRIGSHLGRDSREPADRSHRSKTEQGPGRRRSKKRWTGRARAIPYLWPAKANRRRSQVIMTRFACRDLSNPRSYRGARKEI